MVRSVTAPFVHETAMVEDGASVGSGSKIWHNCHIRSGSRIGSDCTIGFAVYIDSGVTIGDGCKIQNHVSVYRGVTLEDRVFVGPSVAFTNDLFPRADSGSWEVKPTFIRTGAAIGANATVVCGVTIGEWAMVAAGAVVTRSLKPHELVAGSPARSIGWVCECGRVLGREDEPPSQPCECGRRIGA